MSLPEFPPSQTDMPDHQPLEPEILDAPLVGGHGPATRLPPADRRFATPPRVRGRFPWGCLLGSCLTVILLGVGGVVLLGAGSVWFYKRQIARYTSETARPLPVVEISQEELAELENRVEAFQTQIDSGDAPEQLILDADDINALISQNPELNGKVFVVIEDGLIRADVSVPASSLPGGEGRFFNGAVTVDASLQDGVLIVTLVDAEVNGQAVPESIMKALRAENLAKDAYKDPKVAEQLRKFESLVVEGDRLILTPKAAPELDADTEPVSDGAPEPVPDPPSDLDLEATPARAEAEGGL